MSQEVKVDRHILIKADAANNPNVIGNLSTERYCSVDWFDQKTMDETNDYTITVGGTADAIAVTGGGQIGCKFTTGSADNDVCYLAATPLIFDITQAPEIESKIEITDVSGTFVFFGFSDAVTETTPDATIDADSATVTAIATDAVGFVIDADLGSSSIYGASVNTGAACQSVDTGLDWTDGQAKTLKVKLDTSGNASFYVNGDQVGYLPLAVADVPLCAIYNVGTRAADGTNYVYARFLKKYADVA